MAVTESARHAMFKRFEEAVGMTSTATLMDLLPPVGWAEVATKHDLAQLEERLDLRFAAIDQRFDALEQRIDLKVGSAIDRAIAGQMRLFIGTTVTLMLSTLGTVVALS